MLSPAGYTPLSEINLQCNWAELLSYDDMAGLILSAGAIFATNTEGRVFNLSAHLLATHTGRFAFVDPSPWIISLPDALTVSMEPIRGDLQLFVGGFTSIDAQYDEQLRAAMLNSAITDMKAHNDADRLPDSVPDDLLISFADFNGSPICMADGEFADLKIKLSEKLERGRAVNKHSTPMEEENAYKAFIAPYVAGGTRATLADHDRWRLENTIGRDRMREIRKLYAPSKWQKAGNVSKES